MMATPLRRGGGAMIMLLALTAGAAGQMEMNASICTSTVAINQLPVSRVDSKSTPKYDQPTHTHHHLPPAPFPTLPLRTVSPHIPISAHSPLTLSPTARVLVRHTRCCHTDLVGWSGPHFILFHKKISHRSIEFGVYECGIPSNTTLWGRPAAIHPARPPRESSRLRGLPCRAWQSARGRSHAERGNVEARGIRLAVSFLVTIRLRANVGFVGCTRDLSAPRRSKYSPTKHQTTHTSASTHCPLPPSHPSPLPPVRRLC